MNEHPSLQINKKKPPLRATLPKPRPPQSPCGKSHLETLMEQREEIKTRLGNIEFQLVKITEILENKLDLTTQEQEIMKALANKLKGEQK